MHIDSWIKYQSCCESHSNQIWMLKCDHPLYILFCHRYVHWETEPWLHSPLWSAQKCINVLEMCHCGNSHWALLIPCGILQFCCIKRKCLQVGLYAFPMGITKESWNSLSWRSDLKSNVSIAGIHRYHLIFPPFLFKIN